MKIKKLIAAFAAVAMLASNQSIAAGVSYAAEAAEESKTVYGDANADGRVSVADATAILQYIANKDRFELKPQGKINGDIIDPGHGITALDALAIQMADARVISVSDFPMTSEELEKALHKKDDTTEERVPVTKEQMEVMKDNPLLVVDKDSNELFVYGDMNGDMKLDAADAAAVEKHVADKSAYKKAADLDGDNDVDVDDIELLNNYLNDSSNLFPVYCEYDSDADGLNDYIEIAVLGTNRLEEDTDKDNLTDYEETFITGTDPAVPDSVVKGTLDCDADIDEDGLTNADELGLGSSPIKKDSDLDGLEDGYEVNELKTNPTDRDTDHDGLTDFEEVKLELDPLKEKSNDVDMDNERIISQVIPADAPILSGVNTEDNAYELSVTINASGYANNNLSVMESGNAYVLQNGSALGFTPQFDYNEDYKVESVTLNFTIKEAYRDNILPYMNYSLSGNTETTYELAEELEGIKRLNVFKYYENINIALPINTEYDVDNNIVSVTIDTFETDEDGNSLGIGSYSLVDLELWGKMMNEQAVEKTASSDEESESEETIKSTETVSINDDNQGTKKTYTIDTEKAKNMNWSLINKNLQTYTDRVNASSGAGYSSSAGTITRWNGHSYAYFEDREAYLENKSIIEECQKKGGYILTIDSQSELDQFQTKREDGVYILHSPGLYHFGCTSALHDWPFIFLYYMPSVGEVAYQRSDRYGSSSFFFDGKEAIPNYEHFRVRTVAAVDESIPCGYICEWSSDSKITDPACLRIGGKPYAFLEAPLTVNGTTDSDHDGISDWNEIDHDTIAKLTGSDAKTSVSWNTVKKYANDNKLNGKHGMATSKTELVYTGDAELTPTKTNPAEDDSDHDGILDNDDPEPKSNYKTKYVYDGKQKYVITESFEDIKTNDDLDRKDKEADATWGTDDSISAFETQGFRGALTCFGGNITHLKNASKFLDHFLENTGEDLNYDATTIVEKTDLGQISYCENVNDMIKLCEDTVTEKCELNFKTPSYVLLEGAKFSSNSNSNILVDVFKSKDDRDKITVDWQYSVGDVNAAISVNCKKNGDTYVATVKYYFLDYYDWVPNSKAKGGLVTDGEMYELHAAGYAKEYKSIGLYEKTIEWKKGEKLLYKGDDLIVGKIKSA